ncbi:MAG: TOMM precursor leader peptide-binding protein [Acidimicrobiia bacterium]
MTEVIRKARVQRNPWLRFVACSADEVLVRHGTRSQFSTVLYDEQHCGFLAPALEALAAPHSVDELAAAVAPGREGDVAGLVDTLFAQGILLPEDAAPIDAFAAVQYAGATLSEAAAVTVLGEGSTAARVHEELAAAGLPVVGRPTVDGGDTDFRDPAVARAALAAAGTAVVATDSFSPSTFHAVNEAAIETGRPWLLAYCDGSHAVVGPWFVPHVTPCYAEVEAQLEAGIVNLAEYLVFRDAADGRAAPTFSPYRGVAAAWAVAALVPMLAGASPPLLGRFMTFDFERMSIDTTDVLRLPRCPRCSDTPTRHVFA